MPSSVFNLCSYWCWLLVWCILFLVLKKQCILLISHLLGKEPEKQMLGASSMKEVGVLTTWRTKRFTSVRMTCLVDQFLILCSDTYNRTGLGWFSWQKTRGLLIPVVLKWGTSRSWFWWEACEMHTFSMLCVVRLFWEKYCCHIEILVSLGSVFLVFMCKVEIFARTLKFILWK